MRVFSLPGVQHTVLYTTYPPYMNSIPLGNTYFHENFLLMLWDVNLNNVHIFHGSFSSLDPQRVKVASCCSPARSLSSSQGRLCLLWLVPAIAVSYFVCEGKKGPLSRLPIPDDTGQTKALRCHIACSLTRPSHSLAERERERERASAVLWAP